MRTRAFGARSGFRVPTANIGGLRTAERGMSDVCPDRFSLCVPSAIGAYSLALS